MSTEAILRAVSAIPNRYHSEERLQDAVAAALANIDVDFTPEAMLDQKNRIDFLLPGRLGIECKTRSGGNGTLSQLYRYAAHLEELILITTKPVDFRSGTIHDSQRRPVALHVVELWKNPT